MTSDTVHEDERGTADRSSGPPSDGVKIIGAERAGGASPAGEPPEEGDQVEVAPGDRSLSGTAGESADHPSDFGPEDWDAAPEPPLLHWTEAPTGEVPAVLSRREAGEDPWASVPEPTWREERTDWEQEEPFAPSLLAGEEEGLHPLDSADLSERQPWSFDEEEVLEVAEVEGGEELMLGAEDELGGDLWPSTPTTGAVPAQETQFESTVAAGRVGEGTSDVDEVAGEKTTVMRPPPSGEDDLAAAALAADLAERGGRRSWRPGRLQWPGSAHRHRGEAPLAGETEPVGATRVVPAVTGVVTRVQRRQPPHPAAGNGHATGSARRASHPPPGAKPKSAGRNIPLAVASGLVIGALALVAFHFGSVPSMVLVTTVVGLAAVEAYAAFRRAGYHPATLLGLVAVVSLLIASYDKGERALPIVLVLLVAFTFLWQLVGVDRRAEPVRSTAATLLVFCWVGVFGSFAALLLAPSLFPNRHGIAFLLGALIAGVAYDVGALAIGAWLGRHPLSTASPGKTWEGVIGGAVASVVFAVAIVHLIHPWTVGSAAALGLVVAVVSPIGDLCESLVKRQLGLKDMGRILPGHGGLLDRVDGLLFVLPATFYLVQGLHLA